MERLPPLRFEAEAQLGEGVHGEIVPAAVIISVRPGRASNTAVLPTGVHPPSAHAACATGRPRAPRWPNSKRRPSIHRDRGGLDAGNAARARTGGVVGLLAALAAVLLILALVLASRGL
jgi:hypothetical protein